MSASDLRRRLRSALTVVAVLLVVCSEFVLLTFVYRRPAPVHAQWVTQARLAGTLSSATVSSRAAASAALGGVETLHTQGVASSRLAPLHAAAENLQADPRSPAALVALRRANDVLGTSLARHERNIDDEAETTYVILLALASVGWFGWFRRVVRKQRALQRTLTEQTAAAEGEAKLAALVRNASDVIAVVDLESTISYVSPSSSKVLGAVPEDLIASKFTDLIHPDDIGHFVRVLTTTSPDGEQAVSVRVRRNGLDQIHAEGEIRNLLDDPTVGGLIVTIRDVTDRRLLEEQLTHQALHDSLTGLANRRLFADRLAHALQRRGERMAPQTVLFIDLDDFKTVNDSLGHGPGDAVLAAIGSRIGGLLRAGDTVARVGGDEFAVLIEGATIAEAQEAADRLNESISQPIDLGELTVQINASIGITQAIPGEVTAQEALRNADLAMYWAKESGKATSAVYESRLHVEALERLQLRADLQHALRSDELVLHYQPEVDLATGAIVAVEALVRWQHPTRGLLPPMTFVPLAEETRLITSLDRWVLQTACRTAADLQAGYPDLAMSVNLSAAYLDHPDLVPTVAKALRDNDLAPRRLVLEITESAILRDLTAVSPRLAALREMGVRIAIDDFGTGYSSLAYLSQLDVDLLKIDKSFIDRVVIDRQDAAITEAIISIGHSLNLQTVAEGVEDAEQAEWVRASGCAIGQGYVWSRPLALADLEVALRDGLRMPSAVVT
ncbi:MAG TPA: EAL domain-containing protein [Mycobacteriales bacterium]|nr:EAL domain-containing protein [Mycobacteriales bacterium]